MTNTNKFNTGDKVNYEYYVDDLIGCKIVQGEVLSMESFCGGNFYKIYIKEVGTEVMVYEDEISLVESKEEESEEEEENFYQYSITSDIIVLVVNGVPETIDVSHPKFKEVRTLILDEEFEKALTLMDVGKSIEKWGNGLLKIEDGVVTYGDTMITNKLVDKIVGLMDNGDETFTKYANFLNKVLEQESYQTRSRLMDFVAHDMIEITDKGKVIAFKNVKDDYYDKHSGKFRNMVGDEPSMPRNEVDDDHNNTCSAGLHVCSPEYLKGFWGTSGKTVKVEVDPRDFVAVPYDYSDSKARVCRYTVVEDVSDNIDEYL